MSFEIKNNVLERYIEEDGITEVAIPYGVRVISKYAFWNCRSLTAVSIPVGVIRIHDRAFWNCRRLKTVNLPDSVVSIGCSAFLDCTNLESIRIPKNVDTICYGAFMNCRSLRCVSIPDTLTTIDSYAFSGCWKLTKISLPANLLTIGKYAFENCTSLSALHAPNTLTSIHSSAFKGCTSLIDISLPKCEIGEEAFTDTAWLEHMRSCDPLVILNGTLLDGRTSFGEVAVPDNVTAISPKAFYKCKDLFSITIPDSIKTIENKTFEGCEELSSVTFPESLSDFNDNMFQKCERLDQIHWIGHLKIRGLDSNYDGSQIVDALRMVKTKDFSIKMPDELKMLFISAMYLESCDSEAFQFIKKNKIEFVESAIRRGDQDFLYALIKAEGIFTKRNIDKFLEYAIHNEQPVIFMQLLHFKEGNLDFQATESKLKL